MYIFVIFSFVISMLFGRLAILNILFISKKKRLFDQPNIRKVHTKQISRLGGVSFLPAIFLSFCLTLGVRRITGYDVSSDLFDNVITELMFLFSGVLLIHFIGLADDLVGVNYKSKFVTQALSAIFLVCAGLHLSSFSGLFAIYELPYWLSIAFTVVAIVLVVNSFNLIDGVDGLCSGLSIVALLFLGFWFLLNSYYVYAMLIAATLGAVIVFFVFNTLGKRLKVFMGDAGSLMLGYLICYLILKYIELSPTSHFASTNNALVISLSLIFIPVFDTCRVFADRIIRGHSPFLPDKTHIHHYVLRMGFTHLQSTFAIILTALVLSVINILLYNVNINILFAVDILYGLIFLCFLPKYVVKKREEGKLHLRRVRRRYKNRRNAI